MMEMIQRDRESPAWTILLRMHKYGCFYWIFQSEDYVAILNSCMKKLEEEMKKVHQMCEKTKDSQITGES